MKHQERKQKERNPANPIQKLITHPTNIHQNKIYECSTDPHNLANIFQAADKTPCKCVCGLAIIKQKFMCEKMEIFIFPNDFMAGFLLFENSMRTPVIYWVLGIGDNKESDIIGC